jgi:hypothetical protein
MTHCPRCGHTMGGNDGWGRAMVPREITCTECEHVWAVLSSDPLTLAEVDAEAERAETD